MNNIRYAIIEFSFRYGVGNFLQCQLMDEGFSDIKEAEDRRLFWLKQDQSLNPQNISVVQYVE